MFPTIIFKTLNNSTLKILMQARQTRQSIQKLMMHGVLVAQIMIELLMPLYISAASVFLPIETNHFM